jgi:hypothetical protein
MNAIEDVYVQAHLLPFVLILSTIEVSLQDEEDQCTI